MTDCRGCGHVDCICSGLDQARAMIAQMADELAKVRIERNRLLDQVRGLSTHLNAFLTAARHEDTHG